MIETILKARINNEARELYAIENYKSNNKVMVLSSNPHRQSVSALLSPI